MDIKRQLTEQKQLKTKIEKNKITDRQAARQADQQKTIVMSKLGRII